jgi:hypothetical protein
MFRKIGKEMAKVGDKNGGGRSFPWDMYISGQCEKEKAYEHKASTGPRRFLVPA